jgi:hypothetical protein
VSRRRKPPEPSPVAIPFNAVVVCTDRGQHPPALITRLVDEQAPGLSDGRRTVWQDTPRRILVSGQHAPELPDRLGFRCRRCGRDVRLRMPNALAALDTLRQVQDGRLTLDISLL